MSEIYSRRSEIVYRLLRFHSRRLRIQNLFIMNRAADSDFILNRPADSDSAKILNRAQHINYK